MAWQGQSWGDEQAVWGCAALPRTANVLAASSYRRGRIARGRAKMPHRERKSPSLRVRGQVDDPASAQGRMFIHDCTTIRKIRSSAIFVAVLTWQL